jgi:hypothetical protein
MSDGFARPRPGLPPGRRGALSNQISRLMEVSNTWEGGDNMFTIKPLFGWDDDDDDDCDDDHDHKHHHHHHHHHDHHHRKHDDHDDHDD